MNIAARVDDSLVHVSMQCHPIQLVEYHWSNERDELRISGSVTFSVLQAAAIEFESGVEVGFGSCEDIEKGGTGKGSENGRVGFGSEGDKEFSFVFGTLCPEFHGSGMDSEIPSKDGIGIMSSMERQNGCEIGDYVDFGAIRMSDDSSGMKHFEGDGNAMEIVSGEGINIAVNEKERGKKSSFASLELLKNYGSGFRRLRGEEIRHRSLVTPCQKVFGEDLSAEEIFRAAGEIFIQSSSQGISHRFSSGHMTDFHFSNMSEQQIKDVQLAVSLFLAAESVSFQQFERATRLLNHTDMLAAQDGSAVQRVVYYFSEALRERVDRNTRSLSIKGLGKMQDFNIEEAMMSLNPASLASQLQTPFAQVYQLTAMQVILENVAHANKVHVIDFGIKCGVQWTILMQALATREALPLEHLKLTAVSSRSKHKVADTGTRLTNYAQSLNLPFTFSIVMVDDMLSLHEDLFEQEDDEVVAIYIPFVLRTLLSIPDRLEHMMRVIRSTQPCVMVMIEVEANHNSPAFGDRFTEALFYFSAYFDCLATCLGDSDPSRMIIESVYFSPGIRNIIATEGEVRTIRNVKIELWRAFLARFELVEAELSSSSLFQAELALKQFDYGSCCSLKMNGKSLILDWKGTPLHSLSAWKFI